MLVCNLQNHRCIEFSFALGHYLTAKIADCEEAKNLMKITGISSWEKWYLSQ